MKIEHIRCFLDLTITLNFTETAEMNFTTQSNISKQIITLEKELDITLFFREHRKISLTDAGKALLPYAKKILSDYSALNQAILPFQNSKCSIIKMGAIPVMANYNLPRLIAEFCNNYSDVLLDVKEIESINLLRELDEVSCDIAFIRIFETNSDKYEKITFKFDKFAVVLPQNHRLSKKEMIPLLELKNELFFQLDKNTQLFNLFYVACENAGFKPQIGYSGTRIVNILDFVSNGMVISLMMENSVKCLHYPGIVVIPIDIIVRSELAFIRSKSKKHSSASDIFWKYLSQKSLHQL
ncbi:LysR family transcriptional regulator [Clostridium lacusfryxellense]|uniref:LysR family transcriptional regulator n=1 Tax=Clostridium lacusfryxellense TaxID=205328 RepID=UPI001C0BC149|nr:LysR family transcriptional regulator [Clostridium lacusfryxellense]MBU3112613.1 LysR family transcriptional regulator [Clostridium lacusfryxellense]